MLPLVSTKAEAKLTYLTMSSSLALVSKDDRNTLPIKSNSASCSRTGDGSAQKELVCAWGNVIVKRRALLLELGASSPRFVKMFGAGGCSKPRVTMLDVQDDVYRDQCTSPATVDNYAKDTKCLIAWAFSLGTSLEAHRRV